MDRMRGTGGAVAPVIDEGRAAQQAGGDSALQREMARSFLRQAPSLRLQLARSARESDTVFHNLLVRLQGACQLVGAQRVLQTLAAAQQALARAQLSRLALVQIVAREVELAEQALVQAHGPVTAGEAEVA